MDKDKAIKEIKQLKELLDSGILTQNEYDVKSADLKKIILDSENKKDEPSETEKEYWEKKSENKSQINPPKTEEKKLEVQEEVELKSPSNESSKDSEEPKTEITNSTLLSTTLELLMKVKQGFRKWLNKKESPLTNFLYIALGFIVIPSGFFVYMTFQNYVLGLPDGSSTYGEYPFESNYIYLVVWFAMGVPIILLISYLISLIKSLKVKTVKVFFFFTVLEILLFARTFQTTIYPALNLDKNSVSETQQRIKKYNNKEEVWEKKTKKTKKSKLRPSRFSKESSRFNKKKSSRFNN